MKKLFHLLLMTFSMSSIANEPIPTVLSTGCLVDGDTITLKGYVTLEVFPGKYNYESIYEGDDVNMYWIITSERTFTCDYTRNYNSGDLIRNAGIYNRFHLASYKFPKSILSNARNANYEQGKGQITLTGKLMSSHNIHHKTQYLLLDAELID